jgi:hypothetical protein
MREVFQKIIRYAKTFLPFFVRPPTLPMLISPKDKKDSEWENFKQDLIDSLILLAIFLAPFVAIFFLILALAICFSR